MGGLFLSPCASRNFTRRRVLTTSPAAVPNAAPRTRHARMGASRPHQTRDLRVQSVRLFRQSAQPAVKPPRFPSSRDRIGPFSAATASFHASKARVDRRIGVRHLALRRPLIEARPLDRGGRLIGRRLLVLSAREVVARPLVRRDLGIEAHLLARPRRANVAVGGTGRMNGERIGPRCTIATRTRTPTKVCRPAAARVEIVTPK